MANKGLKSIRGRLLEDQKVNLGVMKETIIGIMALVFGSRSDDWQPTRQDYFVFLVMIFFTILTVMILSF